MERRRTLAALGLAGLALAATSGCSAFRRSPETYASIADVAGPQERAIRQVGHQQYDKANLAAVIDDPELRRGQQLYDATKYGAAEEVYRGILRKFGTDFTTKVLGGGGAIGRGDDRKAFDMYGSAVEERAQFMLAESLFMQGKYVQATDAYETLVQRYPSTRHLDQTTRRQFLIARTWLGFAPSKTARTGGDIELAGYTTASAITDNKAAPKPPSFLNLSDKSRPTFDTAGRALNILRNLWINDPTGPLADSALMMIGNFEYRRGDYVEAARHYEILREQYPDSPHIDDAYLLESHVRLVSYDGPTYDDQNLTRARELKQQALVEFDLATEQRRQLQQELNLIDDETIRREWANVQFYRRRNKPASVKLYCNRILNRYPDSRYAKLAQQVLREVAQEQRSGSRGWWLKSVPDGPVPVKAAAREPNAPRLRQGVPDELRPMPQPLAEAPREIAPPPGPRPSQSLPNPAERPPQPSPFDATPFEPSGEPTPLQAPTQQLLQQVGFEQAASQTPPTPVRTAEASAESGNPFAEFFDPDGE